MRQLPLWVLPPTMPSIYESESMTSLEAVARLHGAMRQLIDKYNEFTTALQSELDGYEATNTAEFESLKTSVEKRLVCKFNDLDAKAREAETEMTKLAIAWLEEHHPGALPVVTSADDGRIMMVSGGKWVPVIPGFTYDAETETLTLNILGG